MISCREAAYSAVLSYLREEVYLKESLDAWIDESQPSPQDRRLATEIAYGTVRRMESLRYLARNVSERGNLKLKTKERALLFTALYQIYFMERVPAYAVVNEALELAKDVCHHRSAPFLNALLRKAAETPLQLPKGDDPASLNITYSYPTLFIETLIRDLNLDTAKAILEAGNRPPVIMARVRHKPLTYPPGLHVITEEPAELVAITDSNVLPEVAQSPQYYIMNASPATLIAELCAQVKAPHSILDLCAAPGGKALVVHDAFPNAKLCVNDISEKKEKRLRENLAKYSVDASFSCQDGTLFESEQHYDIVILDVPCSNTGVLNKRPEARWRLSPENLRELEQLQKQLLRHAATLLSEGGQLWYLTCSILKQENEKLTAAVCSEHGLEKIYERSILPTKDGWDGGYACCMKKG